MCFCLAHAGPLCRLCHHDLNDQPSAEFHKQNDHEDKRRKNTPNRITSYTPAPEPQEARAVWGGGGQWRLSVGSVPVHLDLLRLIHPTPSFLPFPITSQVSAPSVLWPAARVADSRAPCRSAWARSTSSRPSLVFRSVELALKTFTFYFAVKRLSSKG